MEGPGTSLTSPLAAGSGLCPPADPSLVGFPELNSVQDLHLPDTKWGPTGGQPGGRLWGGRGGRVPWSMTRRASG